MNDDEKQFEKLAVMLFFKRFQQGRVDLSSDRIPNFKKAVEAVQFDSQGEPIMDTVSPLVRSFALTLANEEAHHLEEALQKTGDQLGIEGLLPDETDVSDAILAKCHSEREFTELAFELYKEAASLTSIAACAYTTEMPSKFPWTRHQAVCAGLLIRAMKFMMATARLYVSGDSAEVTLALSRCIMESATNVRFLIGKESPDVFNRFIRYSFVAERRLLEDVQKNVAHRGGKVLPLEQRMQDSIDWCLSSSGIALADVPNKGRVEDAIGNLHERLHALKISHRYTGHQRISSHAIHGDWADLVLFHLSHERGRYGPQTEFSPEEPGSFLPVSIVVLEATQDYLLHFYPNGVDSEKLLLRIRQLVERIKRVDNAHEAARSRPAKPTQ